MQISDVSWWGPVVLALLLCGAFSLFSVVDRRLMGRMARVLGYFLVGLLLVGGYAWGLTWLGRWWANVLWALLLAVLVCHMVLDRVRLPWARLLLPLTGAMLAGLVVGGGSLLLCFPHGWSAPVFVPVLAILSGQLLQSLTRALQTYASSLRHTQPHYRYLLANGASHLEAVMPSVRRSLRAAVLPSLKDMASPAFVAPPLLLCGLLLGGASPAAAVTVALLVQVAVVVASVFSTVTLLWLADGRFFDRQGQYLL